MKKLIRYVKRWFLGYCPNCGSVGTWKERTDTGLLLDFNHAWMECSVCDYRGKTSGDW